MFIDRIPILDRRPSATRRKRFIILIDALYDKRVKLIASAAAEPEALFVGADGAEAFEFARTRLAAVRDALGRLSRAAARLRSRDRGSGDLGGIAET